VAAGGRDISTELSTWTTHILYWDSCTLTVQQAEWLIQSKTVMIFLMKT